jgi:hypothetical protein
VELNGVAAFKDRLQERTNHPVVRRMRQIARERRLVIEVSDDRVIRVALGKRKVFAER